MYRYLRFAEKDLGEIRRLSRDIQLISNIEILLCWVNTGEIAIPEILRPFVWEATKGRYYLDLPYRGFPVGNLNSWRNPTIKFEMVFL